MEEETKETKQVKKTEKISEWIEEHPQAVFWTRFVSWFLFSCGLPFAFIVWRFQLFQKISKIQIGGWGIIAIIIVAVFIFTVIKYVKLALNAKYTMTAQILGGICKIILPLLVALITLYSVRDNVDLMIQVLGCVTICEAIAIPLNPLPKWAYEKQKDVKEEERKETTEYIIDTFFKKKKEVEGGGQ